MNTATLDPVATINALVTPLGYDAEKFRPQSTCLLGIDTICPSPCNPRKHFDDASMLELIESVKKHGVIEPILVRFWPADYTNYPTPLPMYELVAGERRWRAAKAAGMQLIEGKIRHLTDHEMLEIQIIENLQREGLTALEEAEGYERMTKEYGYTTDQIADKIGKSKAYVYGRLKLTALCHDARKAFDAGRLTASTALLIARIPTTALQEQATLEITNTYGGVMSYREAAEHIHRNFMLELNKAPFPPNDGDLLPTAGTCKLCPRRTGNAADLFDDVKNANVCTDPECYQAKVKAHKAREIKAAKDQGIKVITGKEAEKIMPHGMQCSLGAGLVALDDTTFVDGKMKKYRDIIGDQKPPVTLVEDKRSGGMVETVEKKQIAEALKAAGVHTDNDLQAQKDKELERKAKLETIFRRTLHEQVRAKLREDLINRGGADSGHSPQALVMIAEAFFDRTWNDSQKKIVAIWAPTEDKADWYTRIRDFGKSTIPQLSPPDLRLLLIDLALVGELSVNAYQLESKPARLMELAAALCIDAVTLKKTVSAEEKAKAKGKKQPPKVALPDPVEASPPLKAAQAPEPVRAKKAAKAPAAKQAALAPDQNPAPAKQKAGKAKQKSDPAPALPANEKPAAAAPPADLAKPTMKPSADLNKSWPFPIKNPR